VAFGATVSAANAATTYTYTGEFFDTFSTAAAGNPNPYVDSRIVGSFTLPSAIPPNSSAFSLSDPPEFTFEVIDSSGLPVTPLFTFSNSVLEGHLWTDSTGNITSWDFTVFLMASVFAPCSDAPVGLCFLSSNTGNILSPFGDFIETNTGVSFTSYANGPSGSFAPMSPVPAALPLFATGLGAIGLLGWRRKRKALA
jgi:hypothetical protein